MIGEMDVRSKLVFTRQRSHAVADFISHILSLQHLERLFVVFHISEVCCVPFTIQRAPEGMAINRCYSKEGERGFLTKVTKRMRVRQKHQPGTVE